MSRVISRSSLRGRDALVEAAGGDAFGGLSDASERTQCPAGHQPAAGPHEQERRRQCDEEDVPHSPQVGCRGVEAQPDDEPQLVVAHDAEAPGSIRGLHGKKPRDFVEDNLRAAATGSEASPGSAATFANSPPRLVGLIRGLGAGGGLNLRGWGVFQ